MKVLLVVLLIIGISPFVYCLIELIGNRSTKLFCSLQVMKTYRFCRDRLGKLIYFIGHVGAGKTTMMCGISNVLTDVLIDNAKRKRIEIIDMFPQVDFSVIDGICKGYIDQGIYNTAVILLRVMEEDGFDKVFDGYQDTYLGYHRNYDLLTDYVDATVAILLNNYVYYLASRFYSPVTNNYALEYDYDSIKIKDRHEMKDYKIMRYKIILEDEIAASDSIASNYVQIAKSDAGKSLFQRFIRHLGKGTIYFLTTSQEFTRAVAEERRLATSSFDIYSIRRVSCNSLIKSIYKLIINYCEFYTNLVKAFLGQDLIRKFEYSGKTLKKLKLWANHKLYYWNATDYLVYEGIHYTNPNDVGKNLKNCEREAEKFKFVFPIQYCFGSVDTYDFSIIHDYLLLESLSSGKMTINIGDPDDESRQRLCEKILKKRSKKEKAEDIEINISDDI